MDARRGQLIRAGAAVAVLVVAAVVVVVVLAAGGGGDAGGGDGAKRRKEVETSLLRIVRDPGADQIAPDGRRAQSAACAKVANGWNCKVRYPGALVIQCHVGEGRYATNPECS